ncbi:MAG: nicotinate-nucleotide adenylyltransferase [Thermoanaerobaculales bacterium]|jgi:nicotinate-nucleotide adenylyltransferase|nr:nicotinate-nucleotide adenylyltransferase [Thermoanaerobaculales bacterium]
MSQRIAVYGGSFDPFHTGHLVPTVRAQETFQFDAIYFVPAGSPPHKQVEPLTPITHRLSMVALATLPYDRFFAADDEVFVDGPSYTVETVRRFSKRYPGAVLYFLLGSDSFSQIATWHRWEELVELAHLVVLHRAHIWGSDLRQCVPERLQSRLVDVEPFAEVADPREQTVYLLNHDPFPISATDVRHRQRLGQPIRELVPHEVNSYIEKYGLYRTDEESHAGR